MVSTTLAASLAVVGIVATSFTLAGALSADATWRRLLGVAVAVVCLALALYGWGVLWSRS